MAFQDSVYFQEKSKERYKIEAKNSELKHGHGYDVATSSGSIGYGTTRWNDDIRGESKANLEIKQVNKSRKPEY